MPETVAGPLGSLATPNFAARHITVPATTFAFGRFSLGGPGRCFGFRLGPGFFQLFDLEICQRGEGALRIILQIILIGGNAVAVLDRLPEGELEILVARLVTWRRNRGIHPAAGFGLRGFIQRVDPDFRKRGKRALGIFLQVGIERRRRRGALDGVPVCKLGRPTSGSRPVRPGARSGQLRPA